MQTLPILTLKRGKSDSLGRFHPWIFSGALQTLPKGLEEGDLVGVNDAEGTLRAIGHWQRGSIAVRVLSFLARDIDADFWAERIGQAYRMRQALHLEREGENEIYRLVHGEGDQLPGLVVDVYGKTAVVQAHSVGMHRSRTDIAAALKSTLGDKLENIYYKSQTTLPFQSDTEGFLLGETDKTTALENGLRFDIDFLGGQKTGFFIDQRDNRRLLRQYARGRDVLNMFCYTGGFSVYALAGDAQSVCSVDSSEGAIELVRENVGLNFGDDARHTAHCGDAFDFLQSMAPDAYDLIVLDPPAFAKHRDALRNAIKAYTRINAHAFRKIRKGGIVFTFSCSQAVSKEQFRLAVFTAAAQSGRHVRILHQLHQPADHPVSIYHPEGEYLKGLVLYVE